MNIHEYLSHPLRNETILTKLFDQTAPLTILDVGSCEGEDSIRYRRLFPNSTVYAFEPLDSNVKRMRKHFKEFSADNITIVQSAVGDHEGTTEFYVSEGQPEHKAKDEDWDYGNKSSSLLPPNEDKNLDWLSFNKKTKIPITTLANFIKKYKIDHVDYIHMDIQGAELLALKGMNDQIKQLRAIWLEVETEQLYENQPLKDDVEELLFSYGFIRALDIQGGNTGDQLYFNPLHIPDYKKRLGWRPIDKAVTVTRRRLRPLKSAARKIKGE